MEHRVSTTATEPRREGRGSQARAALYTACAACALDPVQSFHFPLFMTMLHLAVIFLFSALSRALVQCSSHRARVVLSWTDYLRRVAPTGVCAHGGGGHGGRRVVWEAVLPPPCFLTLLVLPFPVPTSVSYVPPTCLPPPCTPRERPVRRGLCTSLGLEHCTGPCTKAWRQWRAGCIPALVLSTKGTNQGWDGHWVLGRVPQSEA